MLLPDRFATSVNRGKSLLERRNSSAIIPITIGAPPSRRSSMMPQPSISPTSSVSSLEEINKNLPDTLTRRATALPIINMPLIANTQGCSSDKTADDISKTLLQDTDEDVFTQYYAIDMTMDDMTRPDAKKIVRKFEHNAWSGKRKKLFKMFINATFIYYIL